MTFKSKNGDEFNNITRELSEKLESFTRALIKLQKTIKNS